MKIKIIIARVVILVGGAIAYGVMQSSAGSDEDSIESLIERGEGPK